MQTPSKVVLAVAATMLLTSGAALANREVRRIDHPNGPSTYVVKPSKRITTIAIDAKGRGISGDEAADAGAASKRTVRIQMGRGQYIPVRTR